MVSPDFPATIPLNARMGWELRDLSGISLDEQFTIETPTTSSEDAAVLCASGDLDSFSVAGFRSTAATIAHHDKVVIDLNDLTFIDSAGLGAVVGALRHVREHGGEVAVVVSSRQMRLFTCTGLNRIVTLVTSRAEAFAALGCD
jgi:anti-sigma B factor antagonist